MEEILRIVLEYVSIWAPSLVAILGVVVSVLTSLKSTKDALKALKEDTTMKELKEKLSTLSMENQELVRCNKLLLENITRIKDYADIKKKEE